MNDQRNLTNSTNLNDTTILVSNSTQPINATELNYLLQFMNVSSHVVSLAVYGTIGILTQSPHKLSIPCCCSIYTPKIKLPLAAVLYTGHYIQQTIHTNCYEESIIQSAFMLYGAFGIITAITVKYTSLWFVVSTHVAFFSYQYVAKENSITNTIITTLSESIGDKFCHDSPANFIADELKNIVSGKLCGNSIMIDNGINTVIQLLGAEMLCDHFIETN